jgi:hypothetical protein
MYFRKWKCNTIKRKILGGYWYEEQMGCADQASDCTGIGGGFVGKFCGLYGAGSGNQ